MSASDLERALAEARAAAARRLAALKQEEEGRQPLPSRPAPAPREPLFEDAGASQPPLRTSLDPRHEPAPPPPRQHAVPPEHVVRLHEPQPVRAPRQPQPQPQAPEDVLHVVPVRAPRVSAPEPMVARPRPPLAAHGGAERAGELEGALRTTIQPDPGPDYVPLAGVARGRPEPQDGVDAEHLAYTYDHAHEAPRHMERKPGLLAGGSRASGFLTRVAGGFATVWRARAERRAAKRAIIAEQTEYTPDATIAPQRLTEKERRWERRRKRYFFEEILGWILVPTILVASYFFVVWVLGLFGFTLDEVIDGIRQAFAQWS